MIGEATLHAAVRVASGVLSLYLFALIARFYSADDVKDLYLFLMIFGFAASALRTLANVSAALQATHSRTCKLRRIKSAAGEVMFATLIVVPVALGLLAKHVHHPALLVCAAVVLLGAGLDSDPMRALFERPARFATAFASGSALAVSWLLVFAPGSANHAVIAILLQWTPVALFNFIGLLRIGADSMAAGVARLRNDATSVGTLFVVASFDGLVLNLPFLLSGNESASTSIDAAIVIRIFSASLIMFPLILHWSNSSMLAHLAHHLRMTPAPTYFSLQAAAAAICGLVFGMAYAWISRQPLGLSHVSMFMTLAAAFCAYTTAARFGGRATSARLLAPALGVVSLAAITGALALMARPTRHAFAFTALQCAALLLGALAIQAIARMAAPTENKRNQRDQ